MRTKKPCFPRYIPREIVAPIVREYVEHRDMGTLYYVPPQKQLGYLHSEGHLQNDPSREYSAYEALAFEAGVTTELVHKLVRGVGRNGKGQPITRLNFSTVDKLLTAMDKTHLWFVSPLSDFYVLD